MVLLLAAQAVALLYTCIVACVCAVVSLPLIVLKQIYGVVEDDSASCTYYEGSVYHKRKEPVEHQFRYPVRMAVINLDNPPPWYNVDSEDHITAARARRYANTDGYIQNPISVYYCYNKADTVQQCIAEVTNTPWGGRVTFLFDPQGGSVPKSLHVSPMMDMQGTWHLRAPEPKQTLYLQVGVSHPVMGDFFHASLEARRSMVNARSESAGMMTLCRYGFMPHRVALWIYYEAVRLLLKGAPFFAPPDAKVIRRATASATNQTLPTGERFDWRRPKSWPWSATG